MDRKSIIILAAAILLLVGMSPLVDHFFPPKRVPVPATNSLASVTNTPNAANGRRFTNAVPAFTPPPNARASVAGGGSISNGPEQTLTVSNADVVYHFTSRGGGIKQIDLLEYPAVTRRSVDFKAPNRPATLNAGALLPVGAEFGEGFAADDDYQLSRAGNIVRAERTLTNGLKLVKEFDFGASYAFNARDLGAETNHLFTLRLRYENGSSQPISVPAREVVVATAGPSGPVDDPATFGTFWFNGTKAQNINDGWYANRYLIFLHGPPRSEYSEGAGNVGWAAPHNQFFAVAAIPSVPAAQVIIDKLEIAAPDTNGLDTKPRFQLTNGLQTSLGFAPTNVPPGKSAENVLTYYAGPKEYNVLGKLGQEMGNNLDAIMDFGGPSGFFSKGLLICMNGLHGIGLGYGLCIIGITVIIKLIFWPLTASATRSQKRLQTLQPQIKAIAEKYKDDPAKKNEKTMQFMKENKVNPMGSCIPSLVQIPVFFGFYYMLQSAIELRGVHFLWAYDLSQPDTVFYVAGFPINPLPIIMGCTQFWQMQMTPATPGMDEGQQKIMKFMPIMFLAFFYNRSAGLTLYWTVSNLLGILQMKVTRAGTPTTAAVPVKALPVRKKK